MVNRLLYVRRAFLYCWPIVFTGDERETDGKTYIGTSDPTSCMHLLTRLVYKVDPSLCQPKPCAIGSFYQPTLPVDMTFYAVGAFVHTLSAMGALGKDGRYVPSVGFEKAFEYCSQVGVHCSVL